MEVRAILVVGSQAEGFGLEVLGGVPVATVDVLGRAVVQRTLDRLFASGISAATVVGDTGPLPLADLRSGPLDVSYVAAPGQQLWRAAEIAFNAAAEAGAETILVQRLGPYSELDYDALLQFHLDQHNRATAVALPDGATLDAFAISASRRNDAAFLFRHQMRQIRTPGAPYVFAGYHNPLRDARDLRKLAVDAFYGACGITPVGAEVRPGIWVGEGARLHRGARVLAPAYIGRYTNVRASAVVTRCSVLEQHAEVDCGTVIEDSNLLPFTYVGAGLDVVHCVAGNGHLFHMKRQAAVRIGDPKLISAVSPRAPSRLLRGAASTLPVRFLLGMFAGLQQDPPLPISVATNAHAAALTPPAARQTAEGQETSFPGNPNLVVARRYGNE